MCIKTSEKKIIKALENPPPQYCVNAILFEGHVTILIIYLLIFISHFMCQTASHCLLVFSFWLLGCKKKEEFMIKVLDKGCVDWSCY